MNFACTMPLVQLESRQNKLTKVERQMDLVREILLLKG